MQLARRVTDCYIAALLTLFLLGVGAAGYGAITAYKFELFCALTGLWLAALALVCLLYRVPLDKPDRVDWLLLGYGGLTLLSTLVHGLSLVGGSRKEGFVAIGLYCLIVLVGRRFCRPRPWMLYLLGGSMTVWCVIALIQFAGGNPFSLYPNGLTWQDAGVAYAGAYISTTGNTDLAGALLCLVIPALLGGLLRFRGGRRFWLLVPLALCITVLLGMEVRGALLGLAAGLIFGLPLLLPVAPRTRKALLLGACSLCLAALVLIWCVRLPGTLGEAHDLLHGETTLYTGAGRVYIWTHCLALLPQNPLLGTGPDNLGSVGLYFERHDAVQNVVYRSLIDMAHNEFLNVAVQQGIPALVCFLGILLTAFRKGSPVLQACLLCWAAQACFGFSMVNTAPYYWLCLALCLGTGLKKEHKTRRIKA